MFAPGREFKQLAVNKLDDGCMASPAVVGKAIYPSHEDAFYRIEEDANVVVHAGWERTVVTFAVGVESHHESTLRQIVGLQSHASQTG